MKKVVYIDGQNFLYKASEVLIDAGRIKDKSDLTKLDMRSIIEHIFENDIEIKFYGAKVKIRKDKGDDILEKSRRFSDASRRIRNTLNNQNIHFVESGKLKLRDSDKCKSCMAQDLRFQEKGVDVGVAVDMIVDRFKGGVDQTILVSSDTDLLPAIKAVKDDGGEVIYVGFSNKLTNAIVSESSQTEIIRNNEIIEAFDHSNPPKLDLDLDNQ